MKKQRTCRKCGCTDNDCRGCIERTGQPCSWIEDDLCSACADPVTDAALQVLNDRAVKWFDGLIFAVRKHMGVPEDQEFEIENCRAQILRGAPKCSKSNGG